MKEITKNKTWFLVDEQNMIEVPMLKEGKMSSIYITKQQDAQLHEQKKEKGGL